MAVLVGKDAPDFTAPAVLGNNTIDGNFNLYKFIEGKNAILFFYPLDFTFVCPTEIIAFDHRLAEFEKRNTVVVGVSVDSHWTHLAWKNTPQNKGGLGQVQFPLVADLTKSIGTAYDVLPEADGFALRGTFLIDRNKKVRHQVVNDRPLGRDIDEALRVVDALLYNEEHGEVCPAGWNKGKAAMKANPDGVASFLESNANKL